MEKKENNGEHDWADITLVIYLGLVFGIPLGVIFGWLMLPDLFEWVFEVFFK